MCQPLMEKPGAGRILAQQLLRSGTSIGANVEEAQAGQSRADFVHKNGIALKEARETVYWLRLIAASSMLPNEQIRPLQSEAEELTLIIAAIIVSSKKKVSDGHEA
jgi:four helix bundle protein